MSKAARLSWVDTAKGLSIILVVMMHSAYGVGEETGGTGILHWVIGFATPFRMPEFFLISGLFLSQVIARPWRHFADRRVLHYVYFYALWALILILFKVGLGARDPATAASYLAWAIVEPYSVLWFIYMLAVFSAATKLLWQLRVPHAAALVAAAALQIAPIASGSYVVDHFAEYFIYFYAGYALAPAIFGLVDWVDSHVDLAIMALAAWALINLGLVFSPGYEIQAGHVQMGLAELPGLRLLLAFAGSLALCVSAALLGKLRVMEWLRWLGAHSIVVYLAFSIPMAVTRVVLLKLAPGLSTSVLSVTVLLVATVLPLILYLMVQRTGLGSFLFERPAWAHLSGTPGSRSFVAEMPRAAAE